MSTAKPKPIIIHQPVVERFRASIIKGRGGSGEWRSTYAEAADDVADLLLNAGTGAAAEIDKVFATEATVAQWAADAAAEAG